MEAFSVSYTFLYRQHLSVIYSRPIRFCDICVNQCVNQNLQ